MNLKALAMRKYTRLFMTYQVVFFVYLKIYQILHHEYIYLLGLIFIAFCLKINYNTSVKESDFLMSLLCITV